MLFGNLSGGERLASDSVAESGFNDASQAAKLVRT
jgi:hypothetical protein